MAKVAILGANGFLGKPIVDAFEAKGWEVVVFAHSQTDVPLRQEFFTDIFDERSLQLALSQAKPNIVLSTAWDTEHGKFWTNESNLAYRDATLKFAELSFQGGVETFIGLGTMSEYGTSPGSCNAETSSLIESDIYSKSKIQTGIALKSIGERFGCKTHWARIFQAFGPNEKSERFVPGLIAKLQVGEKFSIRTPNFEMDWIHTEDIASALAYTIENRLNHFVDIGTGIGTTVKGLSELICNELNLDSTLLDYSGEILGHEKRVVVDRQTQLLAHGWQPTESLKKRIRSLG
jgi:dTDP-6-deoxy-L-talose 4-dehydrogenase (NAD+)